jgi:hypothetical protein
MSGSLAGSTDAVLDPKLDVEFKKFRLHEPLGASARVLPVVRETRSQANCHAGWSGGAVTSITGELYTIVAGCRAPQVHGLLSPVNFGIC